MLGRTEVHKTKCRQRPSILASFIRRESERVELLEKATEVVRCLGYTARLSDQVIGEGEDAQYLVVITVDTKGTFPGTSVLSKLTCELAKALNVSFAQINFCLFHESKDDKNRTTEP